MAVEASPIVRLNQYRDSALEAFDDNLQRIIQRAQTATIDYVMARLEIVDGVITRSAGNMRLLRRLPTIFMKQLDVAGFNPLVNGFISQFPAHLPSIQESLDVISQGMKTPLPKLGFTATDLNVLKGVAATTAQQLRDIVETESKKALSRVLFSVGGAKFSDMVAAIQEGTGMTLARAKVVADTSQAAFYRIALERQYERIQATRPERPLLYRYTGPNDRRCRPFCHKIKNASQKTWTREEIDKLDNHQIPNVFITGGGFNCRHQWDIAGITA